MVYKKLFEVAQVLPGYPFRGRVPEKINGDARVVQMKDVNPYKPIEWDDLLKTKLTGRRKPDWLAPGDILFLLRGRHNFAIYLNQVPVSAVSAPHFFLIRINEDVDLIPDFLAWQINQTPAQQYFKISAEGSLQQSIKRSVLDLFEVAIPDMEKQKQIVNLNRVVAKETNLYSDLIENRKQMLKAIAMDLLKHNTKS